MNVKHFIAVIALVSLAGCIAPNEGTRIPANSPVVRKDGTIIPPRVGMTKSQVLANYGKPTSIHSTASTETWSYSFNQTKTPSWEPFSHGWEQILTPSRSGSIDFNTRGTVTNYYFGENKPAAHFGFN